MNTVESSKMEIVPQTSNELIKLLVQEHSEFMPPTAFALANEQHRLELAGLIAVKNLVDHLNWLQNQQEQEHNVTQYPKPPAPPS